MKKPKVVSDETGLGIVAGILQELMGYVWTQTKVNTKLATRIVEALDDALILVETAMKGGRR